MKRWFSKGWTVVFILVAVSAFSLASIGGGPRNRTLAAPGVPVPAATPIYSGYKGVKIGMTDEDVRKLLGEPKEKSDGQDYYVFSETESAQVVYDSSHKVTTVSVTYMGKSASIPTPKAVFGEDAVVKPDGSITKIVKYTKDGFTLSYNKTAGDDPLVMITVQKIYGNPES